MYVIYRYFMLLRPFLLNTIRVPFFFFLLLFFFLEISQTPVLVIGSGG